MIQPPFDRTKGKIGGYCDCTFDPYPPGDDDHAEESWHYRRCCEFCGNSDWWTLSCPHEKVRACPVCSRPQELIPVEEDLS